MSKIKFLNLGSQPMANNYLKSQKPKNEYFYKLNAVFDDQKKLVSLGEFVPPEMMFNETYAYRASMSLTMQDANRKFSQKIKSKFNPKKILEIGSNDGAFLKNFKNSTVIGVEPCKNLAKITNSMNILTHDKFWNTPLSKIILNESGQFDLIYSANTISHIHDLDDTFNAVDKVLENSGVFVLEDPSLLEIIKNVSYDQFYDEHAYVFSVSAINNLLMLTNLEIFDVEKTTTHGGSNRIFIKKKTNNMSILDSVKITLSEEEKFGINNFETYQKFSKKVEYSKKKLLDIFSKIKKDNNQIIGYGATAKSCTVLNYCGINTNFIDYFIDTTKSKQGKFTPGTHIPIIKPDEKIDSHINFAYLGAWNFKKEIFNKEKDYLSRGGKFITHVPFPQVI